MTEDDTYDRLRRVKYDEACKIYANYTKGMNALASADQYKLVSNTALQSVGWTYDDLMAESVRRMDIARREFLMQEFKDVNP